MQKSEESLDSKYSPLGSTFFGRVKGSGFVIALSLLFCLFGMSTNAHANTPGQRSVSLTWLESDPTAVKWNVYRGLASGVCSGNPTPLSSSSVKSYLDPSVTAGTTYFYAVSGLNAAGAEGPCSNEVQIAVPTAPQAPTGLQGTAN